MSPGSALLRDLRFAVQSLRRSPGFTLVAVVTLGLGIGANTAAFGILNEVMLRPLPYPETDRLERLYRATPQNPRGGVSPADYLDLAAEANSFGEIAAYAYTDMSLSSPGEPAQLASGARVSANLFSTVGIEPRLGRTFHREEDLRGRHRVLVISHEGWQNLFGGDPDIIGRSVRVDGELHEVVGVLPASFNDWRHLGAVDLFRPLGLDEREKADRNSTWLRLVGRRSGSLTHEQAAALVAGFGRRLAAEHPTLHAGTTWRTLSIEESVAPEIAPVLLSMLLGLSGFVLLIACSNLANLLLARTIARAREFAVRTALGASRTRLLRPLFLESLLLAIGGGLCALVFAEWTNAWLRSTGDGVHELDWRVLTWALGASLFTVVVFGVAPALFALRLDLNSTLKSGARGTTGGRAHQRFGHLLIVGQFALALVLLAGAALFVRGLDALNNRRYGWEADHLVTGAVLLPAATYPDGEEVAEFGREVVERLEALPGVASASVSYSMPFFGLAELRKYVVAGREPPERGREPGAGINGVSPHYFETVGTRVLSGRTFHGGEDAASPRVFVINDAMARGLFAGESPLGRRLAQAGGDSLEWGEIVGVVADVQSVYPDRAQVPYQLYLPIAQEPRHALQVGVRAAGIPAASVVASVRTTIAALDPDLPVRDLQPARATIAEANEQWSMLGTILSFLALLGLALASLGLFGVIARTVAQRTGEFGVRLALGARGGDITRLVLTSGAKLALVGSVVGLLGAVGISRLFAAVFPNMPTGGIAVMSGVTLLLVAIALLASYLPARHASRISPAEALRAQ